MLVNVSESARLQFRQHTLVRLDALARRIRLYLLADGLAVVSPAVLAAVLITLAVDHTFRLDTSMRWVQAISVWGVLCWLSRRYLIRPAAVILAQADLATIIERKHPELGGRLIAATEFVAHPQGVNRGSAALIDKVIEQANGAASQLRFSDSLNHRRAVRQATLGLTGLVGIAGLLLAAPGTMGLWFERNVLLRSVEWPLKNRLVVEGLTEGKLVVPRGDDATISAAVVPGYEAPRQAYIHYHGAGSLRGQAQMPEVRGQPVRFIHMFEHLTETVTCRIVGGDAQTDPFTIEVIDRPSITRARIGIAPPAYTRLEPYELREGQNVAEALVGSEIRLTIEASQPIASAILVRDVGGKQSTVGPAECVGEREFRASDRPTTSAAYHFELTSPSGLTNVSPRVPLTRFVVRVDPDQAPVVKMRIQGAGEMITPQAVLPTDMEFSDTYGLASVSVVFSSGKSEDKGIAEPLAGFEQGSKIFNRSVEWSVAEHGLAEGDRLSIWAEAADFDDISGPNVGKSTPAVFRIVSREELAADLNRRQHEYRQDFERHLRRQEELYSELLSVLEPATAAADRRQHSQRLRQLARRQRDQAGQIATVARQFEQVLAEMRVNALSSATVEERLGRGVAQPLRGLSREQMPAAAEMIDRLAGGDDAEWVRKARDAQSTLRDEMNNILARMLEWEKLEEAVILLRDVLNMQRNVGQETETKLERNILGTMPGSEPAK
ncbi:MAG TPA: hypothetical protein PLL20_06155 [Phycisphaerae bacterium]|nr:hypothetical protein [Phycisphaerae bacterium]HRR86255.1 hypothetical protein [Phycisphaerae bacterium]